MLSEALSIVIYTVASLGAFSFGALIYLWIGWGFYVLIMGLYRAHMDNRLTRTTKLLSLPFLCVGVVLDILANIFIATVIFWELPHEWLVTTRLERHMQKDVLNWRGHLANWVCANLLDLHDPRGTHCLKEPFDSTIPSKGE